AEIERVLREVKRRIRTAPSRKTYPPRYARFLFAWLRGQEIPKDDDVGKNDRPGVLYGVTNFYGWKALGKVNDLGLCSGALYRSARYLAIPLDKRNGSKRNKQVKQNVHIEHTIPVGVLMKALRFYIS